MILYKLKHLPFLTVYFIFGCAGALLLHTGFLWLWSAGAVFCRGAQASHCSGLSAFRAQALSTQVSEAAALKLSSHGTQALVASNTWIFLDQGLKPCPCIGRQILIHCTTVEIHIISFFD